MFSGSMVALVTPMHENGDIDFESLHNLVDMQLNSGTTALIINGTTGESGTLSAEEQIDTLKFVANLVDNKIPVIAGIAANSINSVIEKANAAKNAGATGCLILTPTYIKPKQDGLYLYFSSIAKAISLPIIVYNVPSRTACTVHENTVAKLATISNIVAIKEATGDIVRTQDLLQSVPYNFAVLSGDDDVTLPMMMLGAKGVISVTANVAPLAMAIMTNAVLNKDYKTAMEINAKLRPLHKLLFIETNPIPVKWCLQQLGKIKSGIRLPLTALSSEHYDGLIKALKTAELL